MPPPVHLIKQVHKIIDEIDSPKKIYLGPRCTCGASHSMSCRGLGDAYYKRVVIGETYDGVLIETHSETAKELGYDR